MCINTQNEILFSPYEKGSPAICNSMDELGGHYACYHLYVKSKKQVELIKI